MRTPFTTVTRVMYRRIMLDRVGLIKVFIEPIGEQTGYLVGLQLVTESGDLFNLGDLDDMCLRPDNISELMGLCERKLERLCSNYLLDGHGIEDVKFISGRCRIDKSSGTVHVECALEY